MTSFPERKKSGRHEEYRGKRMDFTGTGHPCAPFAATPPNGNGETFHTIGPHLVLLEHEL
ncbi:MAG: hypothetical protein DDT34_02271 [Firmicutes bacterium]|nr:hypothetical protein [Bacillota bacterium]